QRRHVLAAHAARAVRRLRIALDRAEAIGAVLPPGDAHPLDALAVGLADLADAAGRAVRIGKRAVAGAGAVGAARCAVGIVAAADRRAQPVRAAGGIVLVHPRADELVDVEVDPGVAVGRVALVA